MKVLIWGICILAMSIIVVSLKYAGVLLGFMPTALLYLAMYWIARTLCKKWDAHKNSKKLRTSNKGLNATKATDSMFVILPAICSPILSFIRVVAENANIGSELLYVIMEVLAFIVLPIICIISTIKRRQISSLSIIILSSLSIISAISSIILQDPEKCIYETVNPTIYYALIIIVNSLLLIFVVAKKLSKLSFVKYFIALLLPFLSFYADNEGSVFSSATEHGGIWKFYSNADIVFAIDMIWVVSSFVICVLVLLPWILKFPQLLLQKYYSSMRYRERCYKKVADMQSYLEKGIITQEEFEINKSNILKKIKLPYENFNSDVEFTTSSAIQSEQTYEKSNNTNTEVSLNSIRDDSFWKNTKSVYEKCYQDNCHSFCKCLAKAQLIGYNAQTKSLELDISDELQMQRFSIYVTEFNRFFGYVFKTWFNHIFPTLSVEEQKKVEYIISSFFNNDAYIKKIAASSLDRWKDFDEIDINEQCYGLFDGIGHKVELSENIDQPHRELSAIYEAMSWMMSDVIYTIVKTSKSLSYDEVLKYLKTNHVVTNSEESEDILMHMKMISVFDKFSDIYLDIAQSINCIASESFSK